MHLPLRMKPMTLISMFVGVFLLSACGPGFASSAPSDTAATVDNSGPDWAAQQRADSQQRRQDGAYDRQQERIQSQRDDNLERARDSAQERRDQAAEDRQWRRDP